MTSLGVDADRPNHPEKRISIISARRLSTYPKLVS
jgi:hypothetical protein